MINFIYLFNFLLCISISIIFSYGEVLLFLDIFNSNCILINLGFKNINLPVDTPLLWHNIKFLFVLFSFLSKFIFINLFLAKFSNITHQRSQKIHCNCDQTLYLKLGKDFNSNEYVILPEKGLYQNILITGAIGSGKTSSAMYPITRQLISYKADSPKEKLGMLILDVKGNYHYQVSEYAKLYGRENDIITIEISGKYKYNPIDNKSLKPSVLANRLKTILLLFSPNNTESYWLDKSETVISEAIKLCRLYNNNYVTFQELHHLITDFNYYSSKVSLLRQMFIKNTFNKTQICDLLSTINFFEKEFFSLDSRTLNILKSEITRITNCFVSDYNIISTFCPTESNNNFLGFNNVINSGKIVVLNMNINEYRNLSKIIATYLKLDFQTEVLRQLSNKNINPHPVAFISDEYSEYASATDANFFSQSRESKCINIVSTQSYTSLLNALNNKYTVEVIVQNLVNKLWFRSDDTFTIEDAQKQLRQNRRRKNFKNYLRKCERDFL